MRPRNLNVALRAAAALALLTSLPAVAADKPQITVEEYTLPNGMKWLLYEQHDSPTIAAGWTARVGSVNERPGITGISHFFEHMMFKGTRTIGTKNIDATGLPAFRKSVATVVGDQKYYFDLTAFPLKDAQGNTVQVAELVKDVTREVNLQTELLQHERKDMIVKMASQVAHEIRNPLGALTLNIDLLEDEIAGLSEGAEVRSLLATIKQELDALNRVLQEYLECARFPRINQSQQDIHVIIEDLFALLERDMLQRRIVCTRSFEYNLPMAWVDPDQIRRAFLNILRNAMEAQPDHGGSITVTTRADETTITVIFSDNGVGMPEDMLEKVFTPFFTTKSGGTGLGLSITQHIINEHKGEIVCESAPGSGTTFSVRLPRTAEHTGDEGDNDFDREQSIAVSSGVNEHSTVWPVIEKTLTATKQNRSA